MAETTILHSPTLESVIMVEKIIQKYSQKCGKYQFFPKLIFAAFLAIFLYNFFYHNN